MTNVCPQLRYHLQQWQSASKAGTQIRELMKMCSLGWASSSSSAHEPRDISGVTCRKTSSHYYDRIFHNFPTFFLFVVKFYSIYMTWTVISPLVAHKKVRFGGLGEFFAVAETFRSRELLNKEFGKHSVVELHLSSLARTKLLSSLSCLVICGKSGGGLIPFLADSNQRCKINPPISTTGCFIRDAWMWV